jgi:CubicO group peptidase (beta-lactamase class C family)
VITLGHEEQGMVATMIGQLERRRRISALFMCGLLAVAACSGGHHEPAASQAHELDNSIDQRLDSLALDQVRAVLVLRQGKTLLADYRGSSPKTTWDIESVTKSILSILVGEAIEDGKLELSQTLDELLPRDKHAMAPWQQKVTVRDLLTYTGGFSGNTDDTFGLMSTANPVDHLLSRGSQVDRGHFLYSNEGSHILATVLRQATGMSVLAYARTKLFDPLDIATRPAYDEPVQRRVTLAGLHKYLDAGFAWPTDSAGTQLGWGLAKLTPTDMAKIGLLMLNGGRWHDQQIVPAPWVKQSTRRQVSTDWSKGIWPWYGYQWWVTTAGHDAAYLAYGYGGQMIEVVPARDLVVVVASELDYTILGASDIDPHALTRLVDEVILPQAS